MKKKLTALALATGIALTGCSTTMSDNPFNVKERSASSAQTATPSISAGGKLQTDTEPNQRDHDYYQVIDKASFTDICPDSGFAYTGVVDSVGRIGSTCGVITSEIVKSRVGNDGDFPANATPLGMKGIKNTKVTVEKWDSHKKASTAYFYNQSHLIADSLGGDWTYENNIAGTRQQNVGDGSGGMRYMEKKVSNFLTQPANKNCDVTYEVTPVYSNPQDIVPRFVTVDAKSCDGKIDEKVAVFNDAQGYTIDYTTGKYTKN